MCEVIFSNYDPLRSGNWDYAYKAPPPAINLGLRLKVSHSISNGTSKEGYMSHRCCRDSCQYRSTYGYATLMHRYANNQQTSGPLTI